MIYIVIPVHNRIKKTIRCLNSIRSQGLDQVRVVVVDDGSTDGTAEILKHNYTEVHVLQGSGSLFWTGAVEFGVQYVLSVCNKNDWILLVNNDVQLTDNTIKNLVSFAERKKVIVNALSVDIQDKNTIIKSGTRVNSWMLNSTTHALQNKSLQSLDSDKAIQVDLLTGRCLLHPVQVFLDIGNYDSKNFPHYGGDDDFSVRAASFGYKLYVLPSSIVYLDNCTEPGQGKRTIFDHLFGIRSSSNVFNKWRFAKAHVPLFSRPTYYVIAVLKSVLAYFIN